MAERFPIEGYLVPAELPALSEGMTRLAVPLTRGVPQTVELDRDVSLMVVVPTGVAVTWRDADHSAPVSVGAEQLQAVESASAPAPGLVDRGSPRALVLLRDRPIASIPLVAGARRNAPDDGGEAGEVLELAIMDWDLRAGTLLGAGDFGSRLDVAFRRTDSGSARFATPPAHPRVAARLVAEQRLESDVEGEA